MTMMQPALEAPARNRLGRFFHDTLSGYLGALTPQSRRFWLLVPCVGAVAGLSAVGGVHFLSWVQALAWGSRESLLTATLAAPLWRRVVVPTTAGVIVTAVELLQRGAPTSHGTSQIIESIWARRGRVPLGWAVGRGLLTLVVVAMGASLGREGALIFFGAAVASFLGRRFQLGADHVKLLVACGASAGIAAVYNTPIGGALFGLEVFLGGLALELYGPIIFASVTATLISRVLLYDHPSYVIPRYRLHHPGELLFYLALGVIVGVVAGLFVTVIETTTRVANSIPRRWRQFLPIGALALVGGVGVEWPEVFGNGYDTVNLALAERLPFTLLLWLPVLKLLLSSVCASAGVPGALFTPSLFVGGLVGGAFGVAAHHFFPQVVSSSGGYVVAAMGAMLAGSTHATLAAALMLFEMTGSYDLILPLLAACVLSTAVSRVIAPESIYTAPLRRRGVELPRLSRPAWMQREGVRRLVRDDAVAVRLRAPVEEVVLAAARLDETDDVWVVSDDGRLRGAIPLVVLRDVLVEQPDLSLLVAADLMHPAGAISVDASLWEVTRRALAADVARLPIVSPREGGKFVGTIAIADVLAAAAAA
jgi:CIC family chloride channel protein